MKYSNAGSVSRPVAGIAAALALCAIVAAPAMAVGPVASAAPVYNPAAEVRFKAVITGAREDAKGSPLPGLHLITKSEGDVYLGPRDFLRIFKTNFPPGAGIEVIGSRVKAGDSSIVLAREVTEGATTITLRGNDGAPEWEHWGATVDPAAVSGGE